MGGDASVPAARRAARQVAYIRQTKARNRNTLGSLNLIKYSTHIYTQGDEKGLRNERPVIP